MDIDPAEPAATRSAAAGWDSRPAPRLRKRRGASEAGETVPPSREAWARRHPTIAKAERKLRKDRVQLLERWKHKNDGTPETHEHARHQEGALARLYKIGAIDAEQLVAAVEIAQVAERIGADVAVRTASLETRVDRTRMGDEHFYESLSRVRHEVAYGRWRASVKGPIGAVLEMIVGDPVGFSIVARRWRMHHKRAKRLLIDALNLWPRILHDVVREIDDAELAVAHAGILGG